MTKLWTVRAIHAIYATVLSVTGDTVYYVRAWLCPGRFNKRIDGQLHATRDMYNLEWAGSSGPSQTDITLVRRLW
jgi:hypothetical protein